AARVLEEPREEMLPCLAARKPRHDPLHLQRLVEDDGEAHVAVCECLDEQADVERARAAAALVACEPHRPPAAPRSLFDEGPVDTLADLRVPLELACPRRDVLDRERASLVMQPELLRRQSEERLDLSEQARAPTSRRRG